MERFSKGKRQPLLIAKLEKPEAMDNLDSILDDVDGVMVARGDLGVELPPERCTGFAKADYPRRECARQTGNHRNTKCWSR